MAKIVLVGAGSYVFARDIITDVLLCPSLRDSSISLVDIDPERLDMMTAFTRKTGGAAGVQNADRFNHKS